MSTRTLLWIALGLWVVLAAAVGYAWLRATVTTAPDYRTALSVTRAEEAFVREQMRTMLANVQVLTGALAAGDRERAVQVARAAGAGGEGLLAAPALMLRLPPAFRELAGQMHAGFQVVADAARGGASTEAVLGKLELTLATCVGCHASFRLRVDGAP
jgi:cytochrome c556